MSATDLAHDEDDDDEAYAEHSKDDKQIENDIFRYCRTVDLRFIQI